MCDGDPVEVLCVWKYYRNPHSNGDCYAYARLASESRGGCYNTGAVRGLAAMGARVVRLLLVPHMQAYSGLLDKALSAGRPSSVRRLEAERVESALLCAFRLAWSALSSKKMNHAEQFGQH